MKNKISLSIIAMCLLTSISCKKEKDLLQTDPSSLSREDSTAEDPISYKRFDLSQVKNPYSIKVIRIAVDSINANDAPNVLNLQNDFIPYYYSRVPVETVLEGSTHEQNLAMTDGDVTIAPYPLANVDFYEPHSEEELGLIKEQTKDGFAYIITPQPDLVQHLQPQILDTLMMPRNQSLKIDLTAHIFAGYTTPHLSQLYGYDFSAFENGQGLQGLMKTTGFFSDLWKSITNTWNSFWNTVTNAFTPVFPSGRVSFYDTKIGGDRNLAKLKIGASFYGMPVWSTTSNNGNYNIGMPFWIGTVMQTQFKSDYCMILDWDPSWTILAPNNYIFSAILPNWEGWYSKSQLNGTHIRYANHTKKRYWATIFNAVNWHYTKTNEQGIYPNYTRVSIAAHWANAKGSASTPMIGHINITAYGLELILNDLLSANFSLPNFGTQYNPIKSLMPDVTIKAASQEGLYSNNSFSAEISHTTVHEMSHVMHYWKAGQLYWSRFVKSILLNGSTDSYGAKNSNDFSEYIGLSESWAEFVAQLYDQDTRGWPTYQFVDGPRNFSTTTFSNATVNCADHIESTYGFFYKDWLPKGVYWDLMDGYRQVEPFDKVNGYTLGELYSCMQPLTTSVGIFKNKVKALSRTNQNNFAIPIDTLFNFYHYN